MAEWFTLIRYMSFDLIQSLVLFALAGIVGLAYVVRLKLRGRAQFKRIDQQGGSALLNKGVMEAGYWTFQPLARALVACHITANQVSWGSFFFGLSAGICLAFGHFGSAAVFGTISCLLDALDGIVARESGTSSEAGEVLDASIDRYVEFFFLGGLLIYYREAPAFMVLTLMALIGSFMVSYSSAKAEALHVDPPKGSMRRPERGLYLLLGAALSPITIPWLEAIPEYSTPIAHPMVLALGLIAVLANVSAVERMMAIARQVRAREADLLALRKRVAATVLVDASSGEESGHTVTR